MLLFSELMPVHGVATCRSCEEGFDRVGTGVLDGSAQGGRRGSFDALS